MELDGLVLPDNEFAQLFVTSRRTFNPTFCLFAYTLLLHYPKFRRLPIDRQNLADLLNFLIDSNHRRLLDWKSIDILGDTHHIIVGSDTDNTSQEPV